MRERYRQVINISGRSIEDVFRLPCVTSAVKTEKGIAYFISSGDMAFIGDSLCEDYDGNWSVQTKLEDYGDTETDDKD